MLGNSKIKVEFWLVKADAEELDCENVSKRLNIDAFESSPPALSKGVINCVDLEDAAKELRGMTVISDKEPPYKMIKHAYWRTEILDKKSNSIEDSFAKLKTILSGKEAEVRNLCREYNLFVDVVFRLYSDSNSIPETSLSTNDIAYLASINASVSLDFQIE